MNTYFASFISGTGAIVGNRLRAMKNISVLRLLDGLVVFTSARPWKELQNIRYFNNIFLLLALRERSGDRKNQIDDLLRSLAKEWPKIAPYAREMIKDKKTFRIFAFQENEPASLNRMLVRQAEHEITRTTGLRLNIEKPDQEFWCMARREGLGLAGLRFTGSKEENAQKQPGKLRSELAHILCLVSEPQASDIVCDPFAGYGSIIVERARSFPYRKIYASDRDPELTHELQKKTKKIKSLQINQADALHLYIPSSSVNKVITDPPWGHYQEMADPEAFYEKMLLEFSRILKKDGIASLLIGAKGFFERVLQNDFEKTFALKNKYDILVSGKKTAIYALTKKSD